MIVLCWNVRGSGAAVSLVIEYIRKSNAFAAAFILEPPSSIASCTMVQAHQMGNLNDRIHVFGLRIDCGGTGQEKETCVLIWNQKKVTVGPPPNNNNQTVRNRSGGLRMPVGANLTSVASGNTYFVAAWHAPTNGGDINTALTRFFRYSVAAPDVLMGDFNTSREDNVGNLVLESPTNLLTSLNSSNVLVNDIDKVFVSNALHNTVGVVAGRFIGDGSDGNDHFQNLPNQFFQTYSDHLPMYISLP